MVAEELGESGGGENLKDAEDTTEDEEERAGEEASDTVGEKSGSVEKMGQSKVSLGVAGQASIGTASWQAALKEDLGGRAMRSGVHAAGRETSEAITS